MTDTLLIPAFGVVCLLVGYFLQARTHSKTIKDLSKQNADLMEQLVHTMNRVQAGSIRDFASLEKVTQPKMPEILEQQITENTRRGKEGTGEFVPDEWGRGLEEDEQLYLNQSARTQ